MKTIKVLMLILGLTLVVLGLAGVIFDVYDPVVNKYSSTVILNLSNNDELELIGLASNDSVLTETRFILYLVANQDKLLAMGISSLMLFFILRFIGLKQFIYSAIAIGLLYISFSCIGTMQKDQPNALLYAMAKMNNEWSSSSAFIDFCMDWKSFLGIFGVIFVAIGWASQDERI